MRRILVVEDDLAIRNNIMALLRLEGYDADAAGDGVEALEYLRAGSYSLLISDVMMPRMDGHQLLQQLRSQPATVQLPVILLTALAEKHDHRHGMNLGADDYLTKPFQREELLKAVEARLGRLAQQQAETQRLQSEAHRLRYLDQLTGLGSRMALLEALSGQGVLGEQHHEQVLVLVLGVDHFSRINDSLGYQAGDAALRECGQRLEQVLGDAGRAYRLIGPNFAVLARVPGREQAQALAQQLHQAWLQPMTVLGEEMFIPVSIGYCLYPADADDAQQLLGRAEVALHQAQNLGGSQVLAYTAQMNAEAGERLRLNNDLFRALERHEFEVYYQPQVCLHDGSVVGFEALLRWNHPRLGRVSPLRFIPLAEENGQIIAIGCWVLAEACQRLADWQRMAPGLRVAVNLSARQFASPGLLYSIEAALDFSGLPPEQLEVEITEGTAMVDAERTVDTLRRLKDLGIKLALDDFGTGYSSLSYLKRFPLDVLKIDQSFVRNILGSGGDRAITQAVISLARSFGMAVIAEGVETEAQKTLLQEMGCDAYQGYLFSQPLSALEVVQQIGDWQVACKGEHHAV
ncbi:putative bifunctional diguanylate cyclase/phosphodiesterase [Vogesella urethralis]|uniref:putative bifunctional diguanylate cyclase/phosphodiesterase n=1 Tax=Vogesella urethralis TaxID=2592656 RepID=UPI0011851A10|nr:EAL domain-containing response regulator [Vogesella urethralis]